MDPRLVSVHRVEDDLFESEKEECLMNMLSRFRMLMELKTHVSQVL